jgi:hypothetical protein
MYLQLEIAIVMIVVVIGADINEIRREADADWFRQANCAITPAEQNKITSLFHESDRLRALLGRLLIRKGLADLLGTDHRNLRLARSDLQKPCLLHPSSSGLFSCSSL